MTTRSRAYLKSRFKTGDKPTQEDYSDLIDSNINKVDDVGLIAFAEYNPALTYVQGQGAFYEGGIYQALQVTTGAFNPLHWRNINEQAYSTGFPLWDSLTVYALDEYVERNARLFKSLQNANANYDPLTSPTRWQEISANDSNFGNYWQAGLYFEKDVVRWFDGSKVRLLEMTEIAYISSDVASELVEDKWRDVGGSGGSPLPDQTGNEGKILTTNGTLASWITAPFWAPNAEFESTYVDGDNSALLQFTELGLNCLITSTSGANYSTRNTGPGTMGATDYNDSLSRNRSSAIVAYPNSIQVSFSTDIVDKSSILGLYSDADTFTLDAIKANGLPGSYITKRWLEQYVADATSAVSGKVSKGGDFMGLTAELVFPSLYGEDLFINSQRIVVKDSFSNTRLSPSSLLIHYREEGSGEYILLGCNSLEYGFALNGSDYGIQGSAWSTRLTFETGAYPNHREINFRFLSGTVALLSDLEGIGGDPFNIDSVLGSTEATHLPVVRDTDGLLSVSSTAVRGQFGGESGVYYNSVSGQFGLKSDLWSPETPVDETMVQMSIGTDGRPGIPLELLNSNLIEKVGIHGDTMDGDLFMADGASIDAELTAGSDVLNIGTSNADVINIGWSGATINFIGSLVSQQVTNLEVSDKLIRLNKGGGAASGVSSGFEIEEGGSVTGYFATNATRNGYDFKAPSIASQFTLLLSSLTAARTWTVPDGTDTFVGTTLTQTLTNKTFTSPRVNELLDTNGVALLTLLPTASAVNGWQFRNNVTGSAPRLDAIGSDTNVGLDIRTKGTGVMNMTASGGYTLGTVTGIIGLQLTSDNYVMQLSRNNNSNLTGYSSCLHLRRTVGALGTNGGSGIDFTLANNSTTNVLAANLRLLWSNATAAAETSRFEFHTMTAGAALALAVTIDGTVLAHQFAIADRSTQHVVAANAGTTTVNDNVSTIVLNPSAGIASHTLNMPANPVDGQILRVAAGANTITALTHSGNGKTLVGALTTLTASGGGEWIYRAASTTWFRTK